jgi:hypothetical protein
MKRRTAIKVLIVLRLRGAGYFESIGNSTAELAELAETLAETLKFCGFCVFSG